MHNFGTIGMRNAHLHALDVLKQEKKIVLKICIIFKILLFLPNIKPLQEYIKFEYKANTDE